APGRQRFALGGTPVPHRWPNDALIAVRRGRPRSGAGLAARAPFHAKAAPPLDRSPAGAVRPSPSTCGPEGMPGSHKTIADLIAIRAAPRPPASGCPWDLAQTFATIAPYTIEEAYEVADAIERGDLPALKDELGDLLLQVVYHARLAEEEGAFA